MFAKKNQSIAYLAILLIQNQEVFFKAQIKANEKFFFEIFENYIIHMLTMTFYFDQGFGGV